MRQITIEFEKMRQQVAELFLRERETMLKAARRWCFNHQQNAEDCVDEAFARLWKLMACYGQVPQSPLSWLYTIARRVEIDRAKSAFARHGTVETMDKIASHEPGSDSELMEELLQAMEQLPARYRRAWSLNYLEQYSYAEIAEEMSCTTNAVKKILQRARNILRRRLAHHAPILGKSWSRQGQCAS